MKTFVDDIENEIAFIRSNKRKSTYILTDGELISTEKDQDTTTGIYKFENKQLVNFTPDTGASFKINGHTFYGFIQYCDRYSIEVSIEDFTQTTISSVEVEIESWRLLDQLKQRLQEISPNKIITSIQHAHKNPLPELPELSRGQEKAIQQSLSSPITIIWGPPGTGKTYTLANIALKNFNQGKRVLIVSQSNMAVDSAILQIRKLLNSTNPKNQIVRYGMVKSTELLVHTQYNSWDIAFSINPNLKSEYEKLQEKDLRSCDKNERMTVLNRKKEIFNKISSEEVNLISKAKIVATTATKATISKHIYDQKWDVVMFDEASMAYVPQLYVAASMAKQNFIIIGDFRQLSPIVQNENVTRLKDDIFKYVHITDHNHNVRKHPWLVVLDVQWRMHPEIAEYINKEIYGMLQTAEPSKEETNRIAQCEPFAGKVFTLINYHNLRSTCLRTESGSRFNVFSAMLSIKTALKAVEQDVNVGIVTPYAAQAKIINSILQEIERINNKRLPIYTATVHQFQGSERDIIIFDTTLNVPQEAGSILNDKNEEDDNSLRLINVAITRARGKFILVGSKQYLDELDISAELKHLVNYASKYYTASLNEVLDILKFNDRIMRVYFSEQALERTFIDLLNSGKIDDADYWHTAKNTMMVGQRKALYDAMFKTKIPKRFYTTSYAMKGLPNIIPKANIKELPSKPAQDDFLILGGKVYCSDIFAISNNYGMKNVPFMIFSKNFVDTFAKYAGLLKSIENMKNKKIEENASDSSFANFIASKYKCACGGKPVIKVSKHKTFWLQCETCGQTIQRFIDDDVYAEYIRIYKIRCKECGSLVSLSRYHSPYCSKDFKHDVGFEMLELGSKEPSAFDWKKKAEEAKPKAMVIKKMK